MVPAHSRPQSLECACECSSCPALCYSMDCSPPGSSVRGILRQEQWSGLPCPSLGDLPDPWMKSTSLHPLHWQAGSLPLAPPMGKLPPTPHRVCFSLRFGSTTFSGELWIWQTNNHISQTMTDTAREIIFTFKSPKSMTKHVTSVDGKTLVSAALG